MYKPIVKVVFKGCLLRLGEAFESIDKLTQAIKDFTTAYNKNASPFVWRKREVKGAQLRNTIINLCN